MKADYVERLKKAQWRPEQLNQNEAQALLNLDPVLTFDHDLPADAGLQAAHRSEFPRPRGSSRASTTSSRPTTSDFAGEGPVVYTDFFVTDLAIVERQDYTTGEAARAR